MSTACPARCTAAGFDDWYPGFLDHVTISAIPFRSSPRRRSTATPRRISTPSTISRATARTCAREVFYSSPWNGGWWRLGDAVRYMLGGSMAVLDTAAKNREELLYDRYRAAAT